MWIMSSSDAKVSFLHGRMAHLSAIIGSSMYMVGGYHKANMDPRFKDKDVTVDMADINIYSLRDAKWRKVQATGEIPPSGSGMCMASNKHYIYAFGGLTISSNRMREFSNALHELDTRTLTWRKLKHTKTRSAGRPEEPAIRDKAAMVYYNKGIWVFAGWGTRIDRTVPNSLFIADATHDFVGWNNELWRYDLTLERWESPLCNGHVPAPRAAHTLTMCSDSRAVLFGGRTREGRVSELYFLDFKTLTWTGPLDAGPGPEPRSLHTVTRLHDNNVLLLGGMNGDGDSVKAQWLLRTDPVLKWERVQVTDEIQCARTWHTTTAHNVSNDCTEVLVFGGSPDNIWEPKHKYWANMTRFFYGIKPLYDMCLDAVSASNLNTDQVGDYIADDVTSRSQCNKAKELVTEHSTLIYEMEHILPTSGAS